MTASVRTLPVVTSVLPTCLVSSLIFPVDTSPCAPRDTRRADRYPSRYSHGRQAQRLSGWAAMPTFASFHHSNRSRFSSLYHNRPNTMDNTSTDTSHGSHAPVREEVETSSRLLSLPELPCPLPPTEYQTHLPLFRMLRRRRLRRRQEQATFLQGHNSYSVSLCTDSMGRADPFFHSFCIHSVTASVLES